MPLMKTRKENLIKKSRIQRQGEGEGWGGVGVGDAGRPDRGDCKSVRVQAFSGKPYFLAWFKGHVQHVFSYQLIALV